MYNTPVIVLMNNSIKVFPKTIIEINELNWIKTDFRSCKACSIEIDKRLQTSIRSCEVYMK